MKSIIKSVIIGLFVLLSINQSNAQTAADKVVGVWLTQNKEGKIEIFKSGNQYFGKIVWGKDLYEKDGKTLKKDVHNPNANLRNKTIQNLVILTGFNFKDDYWQDGKIYDPQSGKTYSSEIKLEGGKLKLTGYIGITLFGRTEVWERVK